MTKPGDELLRRAREHLQKLHVTEFGAEKEWLVTFAEQIVRECAGIARDKATYANTGTFTVENRVMLLRETADEILHNFGLKE